LNVIDAQLNSRRHRERGTGTRNLEPPGNPEPYYHSHPMRIAIGADHAGFSLKEHLKKTLTALGHHVDDHGTHSDASVDYRTVEAFSKTRANVTLSMLDDDHQLIASLPRMWNDIAPFLGLL